MRFFPKMPAEIPERSNAIVAMQGLNLSDNYRDGALEDSHNISMRRFPYFTTRNGRTVYGIENCETLFVWDDLVYVTNNNSYIELVIDGHVVGTLSDPHPQFVVVHNKLIIWSGSDKKYFDKTERLLKDLGASASLGSVTFTANSITAAGAPGFDSLFKAGDTVHITGCTTNQGNNRYAKIKTVSAASLTFQDEIFTAGTETGTIKIEREIPDMEFVCEYGSRLWGAAGKTIYASALDDPTNFFDYSGNAGDSYAAEVPSQGAFTGCAALGSMVIFFKEDKIYKIMGSYPAEYRLYTYEMEGTISHRSIVNINDTLFYMGWHGVMMYSGGAVSNISAALGERTFLESVAGTDGENYYLSCSDIPTDNQYFFVYSLRYGIWIREDNIKVRAFARDGNNLTFAADDGKVYLENAQSPGSGPDADLPWSMTFRPFYESSDGYSKLFTKKRYSKIILRTELPAGSWMQIEVKEDDRPWKEVRKIAGTSNGLTRVVIPIGRCDKCQIRMSGAGPFALMNMQKEFRIGSDK